MFKIPENIATIYYKISLCVFQYQYCGYIVKTILSKVEGLGLGLQGLYSATNCVVTIMNTQQNKQKL